MTRRRRQTLLFAILLAALFVVGWTVSRGTLSRASTGVDQGVRVAGSTGQFSEGPQASFRDMLAAGLKVRRPSEAAFVNRVVKLTEEGKLSIPLVLSTYQWARRQHKTYPFVYFQRGIRLRARRIGVNI